MDVFTNKIMYLTEFIANSAEYEGNFDKAALLEEGAGVFGQQRAVHPRPELGLDRVKQRELTERNKCEVSESVTCYSTSKQVKVRSYLGSIQSRYNYSAKYYSFAHIHQCILLVGHLYS